LKLETLLVLAVLPNTTHTESLHKQQAGTQSDWYTEHRLFKAMSVSITHIR